MSVQGSTLNASSSGISDSVPSLIGPSGNSNDSAYATSFHTQMSRDNSSSSSLMSLGNSVSTHMSPGLVLSVQSGGALAAAPDMGMFVTKTIIPARRPVKLESAPSVSGVISEGLHQSSLSSRRDRLVRPRSSLTSRSLRSGSRSSSASSGAAQVALNVMRQLQEQQAAFHTQQSQAQLDLRLEMQRKLQNSSFEVRAMKEEVSRVQAEKTDAEHARVEAERRAQEAERHFEAPAYSGPDPAPYALVQAGNFLSAHPDVAEAAASLASQREMKKRLDSVQQTIQSVLLEQERERAERELERDTALNRQKFLADQNRELRATLSHVQAVRATTAPHPATGIKAETSAVPQLTTLNQVSSGVINDGVAPGTGYVHSKNTTEVSAAQLRATVGTSLPKKETAGSSQGTKTVTTSKSSASKSESAAKGSASSVAKKNAAKKSASRRSSSRRGSNEHADPPPSNPVDSDSNSSDSSGDDSSSSDYSSSSSDEFDLDLTTSTTTKEGTTVWTYRPYINYNAVEKFNEDASVEDRVGP
ncbi:unnamed protein product [Phytophthora fragariaefolia]|uniref:Unnamed protein product n=1 Tax=Phytophthora fragariaefolia TaxID=1490495 RepID=A0A9W7D349_9STRA|nr:unnamed protein product [Phytophthora fragariaefolia]